MLKILTGFLLEAFFPTRCLLCNKFGYYFCPRCLKTVYIIDKQKCPVCEKPSLGGIAHPKCKGRYKLNGIFSLFEYRGIIRKAVTFLKFNKITDMESELEQLINIVFCKLYEENILVELEDFIFLDFPVIAPIPLHWWRRGKRKFNQAEFLAQIIEKEYKRPIISDLLVRTKNTQQQTKLRGKARIENVKNAFKVKDIYLTEKVNEDKYRIDKNLENILLVDDVATTGATLASAANTFKRAGAQKVWGITFAA